jgi:putative transposase
VFHVVNRAARRLQLFETSDDYLLLLTTLADAQDQVPLRVLAYCIMPNHFHLVVWPRDDGQLPEFMRRFTGTHSKRWHVWRQSTGTGAVYQARYRAFAVQTDRHFLTVCRYVERNPVRAGLVARAEHWPWSSLAERCKNSQVVRLEPWPVLPPSPDHWLALVNAEQPDGEVTAVRHAVRRAVPFGDTDWRAITACRLGLAAGLRPLGRPRIKQDQSGGVDVDAGVNRYPTSIVDAGH